MLADREEMLDYARRNDPWPIHVDPEAAARSPFGGVIASGGYTITLMYRSLSAIYITPERRSAFLGGFDWPVRFAAPVRPGDRLRAKHLVKDKRISSKGGRGVVRTRVETMSQDAVCVLAVDAVILLETRPA
mgnify:CR=1 FL=1